MEDIQPKRSNFNLFHVQDSDRPMWVLATNWQQAIQKWKTLIAIENDMIASCVEEPLGVNFVCDSSELIT